MPGAMDIGSLDVLVRYALPQSPHHQTSPLPTRPGNTEEVEAHHRPDLDISKRPAHRADSLLDAQESGGHTPQHDPPRDEAQRNQDAQTGERRSFLEERAVPKDYEDLSPQQKQQIQQLRQREQEVIQHEQAHKAVGGPYAGAATYEYTDGPDGRKYIAGGEVNIDTAPERNPKATVRKMDVVERAALAPAEPSPQDYRVASEARQQRAQAQMELDRQDSESGE